MNSTPPATSGQSLRSRRQAVATTAVRATVATASSCGTSQGTGRVRQFVDTMRQVASGGTVMDPDVVGQLLHHRDPCVTLTPRERDVLRLMAAGHSNAAIAGRLVITEKSVSNVLFAKLGLPESADQHRRVRAVLTYLDHK